MRNPLVSIITPCYNGEKYLHRFLDAILNQSYKNIEFIFVNDGSADSTEEIVKGHKSKFVEQGMDFIYIYQENQGQAAALNQGLKIFKGDYLIWPDSDDALHEDNIKEKVQYLEEHKECGIVLCKTIMIEEETNKVFRTLGYDFKKESDFFANLLTKDGMLCLNGAYLMRASAFFDVYPNREIYVSRFGQNLQMLLPVVYKYKCGYIDKILSFYYRHPDSHSQQTQTLTQIFNKIDGIKDIQVNVIKSMHLKDENFYLELITAFIEKRKLGLAYENKNKIVLKEQYVRIKELKENDFQQKIIYYRGMCRIFDKLYIILSPIKQLKKIKRMIFK